MDSVRDTAPVKAGEELDVAPLSQYLRERLPDVLAPEPFDVNAPVEIEQFPGGHSNLTYLVRFGAREFVLRRPPFGPVAPTAHDMPRECRLLSALHPHFPLAPRPYLLCEDSSVIGAPFYLMERRRGIVIHRSMPPQLAGHDDAKRRISEAMVDTLAALHSVDIQATGLIAIGKPVGFVSRQVKGWSERWQRAKTSELPEIDETIQWLNAHMPPEAARPSVVHNDYKLDNVMFDAHDPARIVGIFDWEMSTVGDPLIDLGIFLGYWSQPDDPPARRLSISPVTSEPGWLPRAELVKRYAEKTGFDVSNIAFYETFALFKVAVVIQQIYYRYVQGQTRDERFKEFDQLVAGLARAAYHRMQN